MAIPEIEPLLRGMRMARERYLYGVGQVPEDRLAWNPAGEGNSALQLCGRLSNTLFMVTLMMRGEATPDRSTLPGPPATREEATERLNSRFEDLFSTLDSFTEADLARPAPTPWKETTTVRRWVDNLVGVLGYHQGQLNYLQVCYGDRDPNIPPGWGQDT